MKTGPEGLFSFAARGVAFGYDGLFTDATTGDDFAVNRVYDPSSGTWNTPDPAQADVNTYRAFGNSPTNEVDPEGLEPYANAPSREERFNAEWERIGREYLSIITPGEFGEQQAKELTDYINQSLDFEAKFTTWFNSLPPAERYSTDPSPSVLSLAPTAPAFLQGAMKKAADYKAFLSTQPSIVAVSPDEAGAGFVRAYENNPNTVYVKGGNAAAEYGKSIARMGMRRDANVLASQGAVVGTMALMLDPTRSGRGNLDDALIMASGFAKGTIPAFDPLVGPETPNKLASPGENAAEGNAPKYSASLGKAASNDYKATFFKANPSLEGEVVVHHAIPQKVLNQYPGIITEAELHSLQNLRGIPKSINSDVHLSKIAKEWNEFYRTHPTATKEQLLQKATEIDLKYGTQFTRPVGG